MYKNCKTCTNFHKSKGRNFTYWCGMLGEKKEKIIRSPFVTPHKECKGKHYIEKRKK